MGGLGLNLTSADTLIFVEHDWNPMRDHQVTAISCVFFGVYGLLRHTPNLKSENKKHANGLSFAQLDL